MLFEQDSPFQKVQVFETETLGRMLFNDGVAMLSERDESHYHDMITHVPLFVHPNPRHVLVIGGGDGGTVRECLRHPSVEKVTLVEIDEVVINACREHISSVASAMDDPRCEVIVADGIDFVRQASAESYDVVIVDSTDPVGPSLPLFGEDFYRNVFRILRADGICVAQAESPYYYADHQKALLTAQKAAFPKLFLYQYSNVVYPGGIWCLSFASKGLHPVEDFDAERVKRLGLKRPYYSESMHKASFVLPPFVRDNVDGLIDN